MHQFSHSVVSDCDSMDCSTSGFPVHHQLQSLLKLMSIKSVIPSNYFIFCCPLLLPPSIFPSIRVFSNESVLRILWPPGQSIGASTSASVLPMNIQDRFPLGLTGLMFDVHVIAPAHVQSKWLSRVFSNATVQKHEFFSAQLSLWSNSIHDYWENYSFD